MVCAFHNLARIRVISQRSKRYREPTESIRFQGSPNSIAVQLIGGYVATPTSSPSVLYLYIYLLPYQF